MANHPNPKGALGRPKRAVDLLVSVAGLLLLSPVLCLVAASILASSGRPVLFRQRRPGLNGEIFTLNKFRTMSGSPDAEDEHRITRLGRFLRRASIDELPELWNVIKGEMSLVGPRPLLVDYLPRYTRQQARRHEVRPGVTGLAQVSGRNELEWEERFRLDVWYADNWSMSLDLKILLKTLLKVFRMEGISGGGRATMEPFRGSGASGLPLSTDSGS